VIFYSTAIIRAYPDGSVVLDSGGWHDSRTTREAFQHWGFYILSVLHGAHSQPALSAGPAFAGPRVPFEDGMRLIASGPGYRNTVQHVLHPEYTPKPFFSRVADRAQRKAFRDDPLIKEFRAALPVLHAALAAMPSHEFRELVWQHIPTDIASTLRCPDLWPTIIARRYADTPEHTWEAIYAAATAPMTMLVEVQ
jgi:hypothetical protein